MPQANIDIKDIKSALIKNAQLVSQYGEVYLPTFLRLEKEYQQTKETEKVWDRIAKYTHENINS